LSIDRIDRKVKRDGAGGNQAKKGGGATSTQSSKGKIETGDPGSRKTPRYFNLERSMRFPDLAHKPFWSEQVVAASPGGVLMRRADGSLEKLAFGVSSNAICENAAVLQN
jgi:hypothetical protein